VEEEGGGEGGGGVRKGGKRLSLKISLVWSCDLPSVGMLYHPDWVSA
jgi:hypothetical protein